MKRNSLYVPGGEGPSWMAPDNKFPWSANRSPYIFFWAEGQSKSACVFSLSSTYVLISFFFPFATDSSKTLKYDFRRMLELTRKSGTALIGPGTALSKHVILRSCD